MNALKALGSAMLWGGLLASAAGCGTTGTSEAARNPDTMTRDDIDQAPPTVNVQELLEGRVAGVDVMQRGNQLVVRIRSSNRLQGEEPRPLYVVDGVAVEPGSDGALPGVVISEIESIKVLKNPSETAIYGMRGSAGVIIVTTKRPE